MSFQKNIRGYVVAKLYYKVGDFTSAQHWLSSYLTEKEEHADAHKLLGQCYEKLNKPDRAITEYQRSLQLNSKQTGLISEGEWRSHCFAIAENFYLYANL